MRWCAGWRVRGASGGRYGRADGPGDGSVRDRGQVAITEQRDLPDLVGKSLPTARSSARHADFYGLSSHDALGRRRTHVTGRDWKVCFQSPEPGLHPRTPGSTWAR
ncbi:hypothetical protein NKH77_16170 [Streptomyces sp. M19]